MNRWGLVIRVQEGSSRRITSLAKQSRGPKVWFSIQGNVLRGSIDKNTHYGGTGQRGTMKYLRKNYYHRIEYSVTNSLATLMRKWCLNNTFQPYSYSQRLQEGADVTRINTSNLMYMWMVEIKERREYKIEGDSNGKGSKNWEKNTVALRIILVIKFKNYI